MSDRARTYNDNCIRIRSMLKSIEDRLTLHERAQAPLPTWSACGDTFHVAELLGHVNDFLAP